jgi:putative MATE family efflux protein
MSLWLPPSSLENHITLLVISFFILCTQDSTKLGYDRHFSFKKINMSSAKYTSGPTLRHLIVMTGSATTGLMVLFLSDLVDMYFLGLLGEVEIAAAIGFAGSILFFTISLNIGLSIACSALVSLNIGSQGKRFQEGNSSLDSGSATKATITHSLVSTLVVTIPITFIIWTFIPNLLALLGASGRALELASDYISIIILSMPVLALAMSAGGVMRAQGDAKGAMWLTMIGGIINVALDPLFIFGFGLEIRGAAIATVLSRVAMLAFGYYVLVYRGRLLGKFILSEYIKQFPSYISIALPAVLTNLSTPIGIAYVTYVMAQFGDSAVAGNAIISRIQPVVFAGIFALSGIVGPIAGQNFGANQIDRVYTTLRESIRLLISYCIVVCLLLSLVQTWLVPLFNASDEANELVYFFCSGLSLMFIFNGMTFITNALFNNLGLAHYATIMNLFKVTLGTIPFVAVGAALGGPKGILWGLLAGSAITGIAGLFIALRYLKKLSKMDLQKLARK